MVKTYPQLTDGQIAKLVGSTKNTISLIRNRNYWNFSNLSTKDPVASNLCSQSELQKAIEKADRRVKRENKIKEKESKALAEEQDQKV